MSEAEKKRRYDYKQNRKKWILIQTFAILLVGIVALSMTVVFSQLNKAYYISYTEQGDAAWSVSLKDNEFFDSDTVGNEQGYVSELVDKVNATFNYALMINADDVTYIYTHYVSARLEIIDNHSGKLLYAPEEQLTGKVTESVKSEGISVSAPIEVDFGKYNEIAQKFISTYNISNVDSQLVVTLHVFAMGQSSEFEGSAERDYTVSLTVPLCEKAMSISSSTSAPSGQTALLACKRNVDPLIFKVLAIVFAVLCVIGAALLVVFIYLTRNEDINYEIQIKKLLSSYRSYIQIITGEFDSTGYQILTLGSFNEMLGIRDTIQSPILMNENADKTRTLFFIPTNTKILYVFEIKVEDYDKLYAEEPTVEEPVVEEPVVEEPVIEEPAPEEDGIEVIGVVWPEHKSKNKIYKYDPDGEVLEEGDVVLVPSHDATQNKDIVREAEVAEGNHRINPEEIHFPLKKIIGVVKRGLKARLEQG